jgi:large subunit ribosomal protein L1
LPHGTGKTLRVAVFGNDDDVKAAKAAGADKAEGDAFLEDLKKGVFDFDVLIATPDVMAKLGQFAKQLGPKGLMPNPKSGTVTKNVAQAVKDAKAGRVEYRVDKQGIIHTGLGKVSFEPKALLANAKTVIKAVQDARPASIKGVYMKSASVTTSMGPSIKLDLKSL